jgi:DNA modification methylase
MRRVILSPSVTLYHADCREVLPHIAGGVDAVIADPPYGMRWNVDSTRFSGGRYKMGKGRSDYAEILGDAEPFDPAPWLGFRRVVLWGWNHFAARTPVGTTLVWLKKHDHLLGTFLSDAEIAWMRGGHGVYVFRKPFPNTTRKKETNGRSVHPMQKPVSLMAWCMKRAGVPEGACVLDPYMGSGTTGIACLRTGRRFIGVEKSAVYFEAAVERLSREIEQEDLFAGCEGEFPIQTQMEDF